VSISPTTPPYASGCFAFCASMIGTSRISAWQAPDWTASNASLYDAE